MTTTNKEIWKNFPHVRQRYKWDCGVSCVLMTLSKEDRNQFSRDFFKICVEEGFGQTTCTIDLCYLLKRYNIKHNMYTTRQAPNVKSFSSSTENISKQSKRIRKRFSDAPFNGIKIYGDGILSTGEILSHLNQGPAIVLVDERLLSCDLCKHNKLSSEFRRLFGGSYQGHYILVVGWARHKVLYRDPARTRPLCATSPARLQAARLAPGTDCDVILLYDLR